MSTSSAGRPQPRRVSAGARDADRGGVGREHQRVAHFVPAELRAKLENDATRREAIHELSLRGHAASLEPVLAALELLPARDLPSAVAHVLMFGQAASSGLVAALRPNYPWSRTVWAALIEKLGKAGARGIAIDLVFANPGEGDVIVALDGPVFHGEPPCRWRSLRALRLSRRLGVEWEHRSWLPTDRRAHGEGNHES